MSTARHLANSYDDYLRIEEQSATRHEFIGGEIYAMAGGSPEHGALAARVSRLLEACLPGCTPFTSDVRVHLEAEQMTTYPDVSFVCGPIRRSTIDTDAIVNPTLLVEVTSKTTEAYDRGDKLAAYQSLASLRAVLFVSHREARITVVQREGDAWSTTDFIAGQRVRLSTPAAELAVDDVYAVLRQLNA